MFSDRDLKRLLLPLVIEQVLAMLVGMVDTVMVASVGEAAVSGVALVDMVNYLVITVMTACSFPFLGIYNSAAAQKIFPFILTQRQK